VENHPWLCKETPERGLAPRPSLALGGLGLPQKGDLYGVAGGAGRCVPLLISITLRDSVNLVSIMVSCAGSLITPIGSCPCWTFSISLFIISLSITIPRSDVASRSRVRSAMGPSGLVTEQHQVLPEEPHEFGGVLVVELLCHADRIPVSA